MNENFRSSMEVSSLGPWQPGQEGSRDEKEGTTRDTSLREEQSQPIPRIHAKTFMALLAICLIYFSQTFVLVGTGAQGQTIARHFNHPGDSIWLTASLTIPSVVLGPVVAQTADYWGRKWFLVISSLLGAIGCVIASRADSFAMLIAGLVVTGLEFGVLPLLHTVPSEILPRRWRAPAQAAVMIANSFGLIFGLLLGGVFEKDGSPNGFRNYYYVCMGMFAVAGLMVLVGYQPPPTPLQDSLTFRAKVTKLDWIGYALLTLSVVLFSMGLAWSQNPYEWSDPHTSAPFAIGVTLGLALVAYEVRFKADGMFHHGLFAGKDWNFAISLFAVFCEGCAFFAATVYFPFQIGVLYDTNALRASVRFAVAFMATIPASIVTGFYCTIFKKVRWVTVLSFLIFVAFFVCMATTDEGTDDNTWGYPVLLGSALGMTLITLVTVAQLSTPPELISIASGLIISIRSLGGSVGIAIFNAVLVQQTRLLPEKVAGAAISAGLPISSVDEFVGNLLSHNVSGVAQVPGVTEEIIHAGIRALLKTFVAGFRHVWATAAALVAVSAVAAFFLTDRSDEFNNQIDAPVEKTEELFAAE